MATTSIDPNTGAKIIGNGYYDNTNLVDGVRYTEEDPNQLTNDDFLKLMLAELEMQDPTKPMDTQQIMDNQLKMSTIDTNLKMSDSLASLTKAYQTSSVTTAVSLMGRIIENGEMNPDLDVERSYRVDTVEARDGDVYVNAYELIGFEHYMLRIDKRDEDGNATETTALKYDKDGNIKTLENEDIPYTVKVQKDGSFQANEDGSIILYDKSGSVVTDAEVLKQFSITPPQVVYADYVKTFKIEDISKVY